MQGGVRREGWRVSEATSCLTWPLTSRQTLWSPTPTLLWEGPEQERPMNKGLQVGVASTIANQSPQLPAGLANRKLTLTLTLTWGSCRPATPPSAPGPGCHQEL